MEPQQPAPNTSESPLITVVIVTYRRREALAYSLRSAVEQTYENKEIIVVDNASGDGTANWVRATYPGVRLIELEHNGGACSGRNAGIAKATGDFIVTMDDDVYLDSPHELNTIISTFVEHPEASVLACQLLDQTTGEIRDREWCHPRLRTTSAHITFETNFFVEGSAAFRRDVFHIVGPFYEPFFVGCEGHDLTLRLFNHGLRIWYVPQFRMRHLMSYRAPQRPYYLYTRNYIWLAYKDYALLDGLHFLLPKLAMMCVFSIRARSFAAFLKGIRDGIIGLGRIGRERTPVQETALDYYAALDSTRPGYLTRLRRHRHQVQL